MSLILAIHTWPGGSEALLRHAEWFRIAKADRTVVIGTIGGNCSHPPDFEYTEIATDSYMAGRHLPQRLMDTIRWCLDQPGCEHIVVCEYDTLFFKPIPRVEGVWAHLAGGRTFDAKASCFYHNPWAMDRASAELLVPEMRAIIEEGHCTYGSVESSPDVFFAYACERLGLGVRSDVMTEFSRNALDCPGDLDRAREAYVNGVDVIHGVKKAIELQVITRP
jgi:hypothetical protein